MSKCNIHIGMGGWDLYPFNKYFYPPTLRKGFRKLEFYSRYFDHVEINSTFYSTGLTPAHTQQWLNDVEANSDFMFTVKLFRGYTHTFDASEKDYHSIMRMLEPLREAGKLGGLVLQFPTSFYPTKETVEYLAKLAGAFRAFRLFLEVRNKAWNDSALQQFFLDHRLRQINVDLPPLQNHLPFAMHSSNGTAYFRMMGRNTQAWKHPWRMEPDGKHIVSDRYHYLYSPDELADLAVKISRLRIRTEEIFIVFHNDPEAHSLINGFQLRRLIHQKTKELLPGYFLKSFPQLKENSDPQYNRLPLFNSSPAYA
jgi:uncharacterized protein YecE (DUF72 family)